VTATTKKSEGAPNAIELALIAAALLAMYVPTYQALNSAIWNQVGQGHGPVMLALTLWLAWQRWPMLKALDGVPKVWPSTVLMLLGILSYALGRSQDILMFDIGSQLLIIPGLILAFKGWRGLKLMWFPIFFIVFQVPLPSPIVDAITGPLKSAVSHVAEMLLYHVGYPIARSGVTLTIGPYQLLVADACAGLNSIFALEAVGVFYMSLMQYTDRARNIALAILILPISFVSNVLRVIALVLITYYFGDEIGQGFVHDFSGIMLFVVATVLTIATDQLLGAVMRNKKNIEQVAA
jgi:exosortase B